MHVYAYLLLDFISNVCLSRSRLCHALCPPWACACMVASAPLMVCSGITIWENTSPWYWFAWCIPFLHSVWCYACLACFVPPVWLSLLLCIFTRLPTWPCMSPCLSNLIPTISCGFTPAFDTQDPESFLGILFDRTCVFYTPIQLMELWTPDPNLHFSS